VPRGGAGPGEPTAGGAGTVARERSWDRTWGKGSESRGAEHLRESQDGGGLRIEERPLATREVMGAMDSQGPWEFRNSRASQDQGGPQSSWDVGSHRVSTISGSVEKQR
jgi:hypothetical protein